MATQAQMPPRPVLDERRAYVSHMPVEDFIVAVLRDAIERSLLRHGQPVPAGGRALDIGCGGQPMRAMIERMGYAYTGLDARQNPAGTVDVVVPIDQPLPGELLDRGPFHLVLCTEVLEHVADWPAAFAHIRQLLVPGGVAIITCPFVYVPHEEPYDFWRPTSHALSYYAGREDLRVVELERLGTGRDVLGTLLEAVRFKTGRSGPMGRVVSLVLKCCRRVMLSCIRSPWLGRHVHTKTSLYLSNLLVVEKPDEPTSR